MPPKQYTLVTAVTVMGAVQFVFLWKIVFNKFNLEQFWAWAKTKTGLFEAE